MADPTTTAAPITTSTDKTTALDAGHTTTEYQLAKWTTIITSILGVLAAISPFIDKAKELFGDTKWVAVAAVIVAALTNILYALQRTAIKLAAIKAGQTVNVGDMTPAAADAAAANLGAQK